MIASLRCADTQAMFHGKRIARFANIQAAAMRNALDVEIVDYH